VYGNSCQPLVPDLSIRHFVAVALTRAGCSQSQLDASSRAGHPHRLLKPSVPYRCPTFIIVRFPQSLPALLRLVFLVSRVITLQTAGHKHVDHSQSKTAPKLALPWSREQPGFRNMSSFPQIFAAMYAALLSGWPRVRALRHITIEGP
jgi:hypothetical protein